MKGYGTDMETNKSKAKRPLGTIDHCARCGVEITITAPKQKYCAKCSQKANNAQYIAHMRKAYDRIEARVPKGDRPIYADHAAKMGESVNQFFVRAIKHQIELDNESLGEVKKLDNMES